METDVLALLTYNEIESWLKSLQPWEIVGQAGDSCKCPVSTYLLEKLNLEYGSVWVHKTFVELEENTVDLPVFLQTFISQIDEYYTEVTAIAALNLLQHCKKELEVEEC